MKKKPNPDMLEQMATIDIDPRDVDDIYGNIKTRKQLKTGEHSSLTLLEQDGKKIAVPTKAELKAAERSLRMQNQRTGLDLLNPALNVIADLMVNGEKEGTRLTAAKDVLDRYGGKSTAVRHEVAHVQIGPTIIFRGVNNRSAPMTLDQVETIIDGNTGEITKYNVVDEEDDEYNG